MPRYDIRHNLQHICHRSPIVAHKSGIHRFACFALYRALFRSIPRTSSTPLLTPQVRDVVRTRFRKNRRLVSHAQIVKSLEDGYEALRLIRSHPAPRDTQAALKKYTSPPRIHPNQHNLLLPPQLPPSPPCPAPLLERFPNTPPVLELRPRPQVPGRRRVPILKTSAGASFLFIKKPLPAFLGKVLRDRKAMLQKRVDTVRRLEKELLVAEEEDVWDDILRTIAGWKDPDYAEEAEEREEEEEEVDWDGEGATSNFFKNFRNDTRKEKKRGGRKLYRFKMSRIKASNKKRVEDYESLGKEPRWVDALHGSIAEVLGYMQKTESDDKRRTKALQEIVKKEEELARREKKERKMAKNAEKREGKRKEKKREQGVVMASAGEPMKGGTRELKIVVGSEDGELVSRCQPGEEESC